MPVFEYECDVCGMRFERHRHYGDPHPTECPNGHNDVHRVFAPPTIIFKGSGFYVTDNGRNVRTSERSSNEQDSPAAEKKTPAAPEKEASPTPEKKVSKTDDKEAKTT